MVKPAVAATCAMPLPIVPAPQMQMVFFITAKGSKAYIVFLPLKKENNMSQKMPKPLIVGVLASLITGLATLFFLRKKTGKDLFARKPPQLDLDNPGAQDDFPKPPTESELG